MKKVLLIMPLVAVAAMLPSSEPILAQASISAWAFFVEVTPRPGAPGIYDLIVPLQAMDKSREDLGDLRLYDATGREIPYALRVRRELDERKEVAARVFNQAKIGTTTEMSVDLGEQAGEHNEIEVETTGTNFRRRVDVEGSDSGKEWRTLKAGDVIFRFGSERNTVESKRISYPISRYRFLRVRAFADELTDKQAPEITGLSVMMATGEKGELTTWTVTVPPYQLLRNQGAPASSWTIDLGGRVPCDRLSLDVAEESFSRPFQLEAVDEPQNMRLVASGELARRVGEPRQPLVIVFDTEQYPRRLRLLITDYSNPTLSIASIRPAAPARQLVFELKETASQPLHLFFGNAKAEAPRYDFEQELPAKLAPAGKAAVVPIHSNVGPVVDNPNYKPEPLPLTERIPWLIYLVLAASSIALALILISLARTSLQVKSRQSDAPKTG
jgi:hypothetical protein